VSEGFNKETFGELWQGPAVEVIELRQELAALRAKLEVTEAVLTQWDRRFFRTDSTELAALRASLEEAEKALALQREVLAGEIEAHARLRKAAEEAKALLDFN